MAASAGPSPGAAGEAGPPAVGPGARAAPTTGRPRPRPPRFSAYLVFFNVISALLWAAVFYQLLATCPGGVLCPSGFSGAKLLLGRSAGKGPHGTRLSVFGCTLFLAQTAALAEVAHAAAGMVRGSVAAALVQVLSRLHVVWLIFGLTRRGADNWAFGTCVGAWALAELCRYPYFALETAANEAAAGEAAAGEAAAGEAGAGGSLKPSLGRTRRLLRWLRYSAFTVLYPVGIASEVLCILRALPEMRLRSDLRRWPAAMPNAANFELDLYAAYVFVLLLYAPGAVALYRYMLGRRRKALADGATDEGRDKKD